MKTMTVLAYTVRLPAARCQRAGGVDVGGLCVLLRGRRLHG